MKKTIRECKDEIAKKYGFNYWFNEIASEKLIDEAMELYSQQVALPETDTKSYIAQALERMNTNSSVSFDKFQIEVMDEALNIFANQLLAKQSEKETILISRWEKVTDLYSEANKQNYLLNELVDAKDKEIEELKNELKSAYSKLPAIEAFEALHQEISDLTKPKGISEGMFIFPSHAQISKEALNVYGHNPKEEEHKLHLQKHRSFIEGGIYVLDECCNIYDKLYKKKEEESVRFAEWISNKYQNFHWTYWYERPDYGKGELINIDPYTTHIQPITTEELYKLFKQQTK